jgi:hypothetical protein
MEFYLAIKNKIQAKLLKNNNFHVKGKSYERGKAKEGS